MTRKALAQTILGLIDLTDLNDDCVADDIEHLCARAKTPFGTTAAVCVWPQFVAQCQKELAGSGVKIVTVVNFPHGGTEIEPVLTMTRKAIEDGADEIDLVLPYQAFLMGDVDSAREMLEAVRAISQGKTLKVILETGVLSDAGIIRAACELALDAGADFLKTSTGKVDVNATPQAARIMLEAIKARGCKVGLKPAGGLRTVEDARTFIDMARVLCSDDYIAAGTLRFGASGILQDVMAAIEGTTVKQGTEGY